MANYVCFSCKKVVPADSVRYPPVRSTVQFGKNKEDPPVLNVWLSMACPCGSEIGLFRDFRLMPAGLITYGSVRGIACRRRVLRPRPMVESGKTYGPTLSHWTARVIKEGTFEAVFEAEGYVSNSAMYDNLKGMVDKEGYDPSLFITMRPVTAEDFNIKSMLLHLEKLREYSSRYGSSEADPWNFAWRLARIVCILAPGLRDQIVDALDKAGTGYWEDKHERANTTELAKKLRRKGILK